MGYGAPPGFVPLPESQLISHALLTWSLGGNTLKLPCPGPGAQDFCMLTPHLILCQTLSRLGRILLLSLLALGFGRLGMAQDITPHSSSLGQKFVSVPGTAVQFATTETRIGDYVTFLQSTGRSPEFTPHFPQTADHPAVGVTLSDALAFCTWLTNQDRQKGLLTAQQQYRLPTTVEWSAAAGIARARKPGAELTAEETLNDQRRFPWGLAWPPPVGSANLAEDDIPGFSDTFRFTAPVGQTQASPDGIFDLGGNVWEWTLDSDSAATRVTARLRGGSWAYFAEDTLRSSYLYEVPPDLKAPTVGFRLVLEDRQRVASLLASSSQSNAPTPAPVDARAAMVGGAAPGGSTQEIAAMRERILGNASNPSGETPLVNATPASPGTRHTNSLGMTLIPLTVTSAVNPILMGDTEVTCRQFEAFLTATGQTWTDKAEHLSSPDHPAGGVTWLLAQAFCEWLTQSQRSAGLIPPTAVYRLPSDLEWSAAAGLPAETGQDPRQRDSAVPNHFPWSPANAWPPPLRTANVDAVKIPGFSDTHAYTSPVKAGDPNAGGFYELGGNVSEWCQDAWPGASEERVHRGGSWLSSAREDLLSSKRHHAPQDAARSQLGFRCVLDFGPTR